MQIMKTIAEYVSYFLEGASLVVIIVGAIQAVYSFLFCLHHVLNNSRIGTENLMRSFLSGARGGLQ